MFTKAKFPQCHASTICETSRGLVTAWFGGTKEKDKDVGIWSSYHDGSRWTGPREWANGIQYEGHRHPCWNPVLFQPPGDAPTLLFFKVGPNPSEWWGEMMLSYDRGRSFCERRRLPEGIDGPVRCKPIMLADGETLLCGSSTEYDGWRVHFEEVQLQAGRPSGDWKRIGPINSADEFNAIQPTLLRHADGKLQALCRTKEGVVATCYSEDDGQSWSKMEATALPNPNSGIDVGDHERRSSSVDLQPPRFGQERLGAARIVEPGDLQRRCCVAQGCRIGTRGEGRIQLPGDHSGKGRPGPHDVHVEAATNQARRCRPDEDRGGKCVEPRGMERGSFNIG